ncbi:MAG: exodeoxyribonuclease VII large subunit [Candidatus Omnitrophota bacterium]
MHAKTPFLSSAGDLSVAGRHIYTVSELTRDIKTILDSAFCEIWVEGEVSGISRIATGTTFFSLKDNSSILKCVIFYSVASGLKFELKEGLKVICLGRVSVYEKRGEYQLYADKIEPKGIGSQQLALEQLKEKLDKEGFFSLQRKKPLPYLPRRIGLVTSASGAAIKDILKVLDTRFSGTRIVLNPVRVQGEGAKEEIASAIQDFNHFNQRVAAEQKIDVLIVGRGGGSIEDLWAFNEEIVARAIYESRIPVISAVGHERDWTVADLVADARAATPSAAAELVIPKKEELKERIADLFSRIKNSLQDYLVGFCQDIDDLAYRLGVSIAHIFESNTQSFKSFNKRLSLLNPAALIPQHRQRVFDLFKQIYTRMDYFIKLKHSRFNVCAQKLDSLNPLGILSRGYSVTLRMPEGEILKDADNLQIGDMIKSRLYNAEIISQVTEVEKNGRNKI